MYLFLFMTTTVGNFSWRNEILSALWYVLLLFNLKKNFSNAPGYGGLLILA